MIVEYDADVYCFQELDKADYSGTGTFGAALGRFGYAGVYGKRSSFLAHGFGIFFKKNRLRLIEECPIPGLEGRSAEEVETPGIMVILEFHDVVTGDFNAWANSLLIDYVLSGSADLELMSQEHFSKEKPKAARALTDGHILSAQAFKKQTRALRGFVPPKTTGSVGSEIRAMIRIFKEESNLVVSHPLHLSSAYNSSKKTPTVDFMFHGGRMGGPRLEIVSRLTLPGRLKRLKGGLPAGHLGSDHFALGARYRFDDTRWEPCLPETPDFWPLFDDEQDGRK
ncbi:hypothetical protein EC968_007444 [Mortierella alpina]|nr:hypothetical protein EC968_007444 [Mortierella alpina]